MKKMTLKNQIITGAIAISVFIILVSTIAVAYIINQQNITASHDFLTHSFRIIRDDISVRQTNLLSATRQLATADMMGATLKYIHEYAKPEIASGQDFNPYQTSYRKIAYNTYQIGKVAHLWEITIYDRDGDLTSFATFAEEGAFVGYGTGFPNPIFYGTFVKLGTDIAAESWQQLTDPQKRVSTLTEEVYPSERIQFEQIGQFICLVSYVPVIGEMLNKESKQLEPVQMGIVKAVQRLDSAFVERLSNLTDTTLNIFTPEGLSVGAFPDYQTLAPNSLRERFAPQALTIDTLILNDVTLGDESYFQGVLPLYDKDAYIGAMAVLYSKKIARSNTLQMIKTLSLIALGCVILIVPIAVAFSNSISRPIKQIIQDVKEGIINGNFSKEIHIQHAGEIGELAQAFQTMKTTIENVLAEVDGLIYAVQEGTLATRGNADKFAGDWRDLVVGMNNVLDAFAAPIFMTSNALARIAIGDIPGEITDQFKGEFDTIKQNLNQVIDSMNDTTHIAEEIASGNLTIEVKTRSDQDRLMKALKRMIECLNAILQDTNDLSREVQNGQLDVRGNAETFEGGWRELVLGVNSLIDAFVAPITVTAELLDRLSKGEIPQELTEEYRGDFNTIKRNLNLLIKATDDTTSIAEAIAGGNLNIDVKERSDQDRLMKALNSMVLRLNEILKEINWLTHSVQEGQLEIRGNAERFSGGWRELVAGVNNVIDEFVTPINVTSNLLERISKGELPEKITEEYKGDFNTIKRSLNLLIEATDDITRIAEEIAAGNLTIDARERSEHDLLMQALNAMIRQLSRFSQEMDRLVTSVQEGKLSSRGNTETFSGGWSELVVGVNHLIDAFVAPISMTARYIERIAQGDVPEKITDTYNGDFNEIKENLNMLVGAINDITLLAENMAAGDLTVEITERSQQDTLMRAMNKMLNKVNMVVLQVKGAAETVASGSQELRTNSEELSQGTIQQAAAMEEASASMEEMSANIKQNADNALQTEKIALQSARYAEESSNVVAETVTAMQQIAQKISIIQEIADQTRMLSLNATIEAARAQEHGKAFSVVASEVRKLSDITKSAAEEINNLASSSVAVAENAGKMLAKLVPNIHKTAELIQEISAASNEQSMGSDQINHAVQQLDQITQQNTFASEQMSSMAEILASQAEQLRQTMLFFTIAGSVQETMPSDETFRPSVHNIADDVKPGTHKHLATVMKQPAEASPFYADDYPDESGDHDERDGEFEHY